MIRDLCPQCVQCRHIVSGKGSVFFLCEVSFIDTRFPKYPRQPVTRCVHFAPKPAAIPTESSASSSAADSDGPIATTVPLDAAARAAPSTAMRQGDSTDTPV